MIAIAFGDRMPATADGAASSEGHSIGRPPAAGNPPPTADPLAVDQPPVDAPIVDLRPADPPSVDLPTVDPPTVDRPSETAPVADAVDPGSAALEAAIRELARDAAALRDAVARFEIAQPPADVALPDDAPLIDTLVAAQAREQRVRDDTVQLTRGLARITTQSALLLVKFTESAAAFLQRHAPLSDSTGTNLRPARSPWIAAGVGLAGIAAVASMFALWQARDNAARMDRMQQALAQSIGERAEAQEAAVRTLDARIGELASREAAIVAAIKAATPSPPPPAAQAEVAPPAPAKPTASSRNAKRNRVPR